MHISFCARIPKLTCSILNGTNGQFEPATFYEIDCRDEDDITYINSAKNFFYYKNSISSYAGLKHLKLKNPEYAFDGEARFLNDSFYSLENKNGEIVGLCETQLEKDCIDIKFLESSKKQKLKYIGQNMLACIAILCSDTGKNLTVKFPAQTAYEFYKNKCHFMQYGDSDGYILPKKETEAFIEKVETQTQGKIVNYSA